MGGGPCSSAALNAMAKEVLLRPVRAGSSIARSFAMPSLGSAASVSIPSAKSCADVATHAIIAPSEGQRLTGYKSVANYVKT